MRWRHASANRSELSHENRSLGADQRSHGVCDSDLRTRGHVCVPRR